MAEPRVPLYDRLPELYRQRDAEQDPPYPLRAFLGLVERAFGRIHENIESLYHDLFIETCDDWVIPYLGDLVGNSPLAGSAWTLRADVADTIRLRRRKGTRGAIELLAYDLSGWGVHAIELFKSLAWTQHLNHQRPDAGGQPPYKKASLRTIARGGTVTLRDPATLSLLGTPFDPFAHTPDLRPARLGEVAFNLPNLAIFLWRLRAFSVSRSMPFFHPGHNDTGRVADAAAFVARFDAHPLGQRLRLFNRMTFDADADPPMVTHLDGVPGPIHPARLTSSDPDANPAAYADVVLYKPGHPGGPVDVTPAPGLRFYVPDTIPPAPQPRGWRFRGANLCAWEHGLLPPLDHHEIAIDPLIGRFVIGVGSAADVDALQAHLRLTYTYGATGPVGAHPFAAEAPPDPPPGQPPKVVDEKPGSPSLAEALLDPGQAGVTLVIELGDSRVYDFDPGPNLVLGRPLILRAAEGARPIVRLASPLRFVSAAAPIDVRLEGLYLTPGSGFPQGAALIARAALKSLTLVQCTLDPGGDLRLDQSRAPAIDGVHLVSGIGLPTLTVNLHRSVCGRLRIDADACTLEISDSIVDGGGGEFALTGGADDPAASYAPFTRIDGVTVFGRARVQQIDGQGGIFEDRLEVLDNQVGCLKYCYFSGAGDRLPQNQACVLGPEARLIFNGRFFGDPAHGQLAAEADPRIRESGPGDDTMGAFGFLREAHTWKNLQIRFREFMPVGVRPLLIPVT